MKAQDPMASLVNSTKHGIINANNFQSFHKIEK